MAEEYSNKLELLENSSEGLLAVLLIRDQLQDAISFKDELYPDDALKRLVKLDQRLNTVLLKAKNIQRLPEYRKTFSPVEDHWWWYIDQEASTQEKKKYLLWNVGTVLLVIVSSALTMEMVKRLFVGTPDTISFFSSALSLALTSSVFTVKGRELWQQLLERIPQLQRQTYIKDNFVIAFIIFLLVLGTWIIGGPGIAKYHHNRGMAFININPTQARRHFQRAAELAPDKAPPCYVLGRLYEKDAGQIDKATVWYEQALERDLTFLASYNALGRMYILQKKYDSAIWILKTGLRKAEKFAKDSVKSNITMLCRYRLLQNLGWAYYAHQQYKLAQETLEQAVAAEKKIANSSPTEKNIPDAPAHYFLANTLDSLGGLEEKACKHWDMALRYSQGSEFLYKEGWQNIIKEKLQQCYQGGRE